MQREMDKTKIIKPAIGIAKSRPRRSKKVAKSFKTRTPVSKNWSKTAAEERRGGGGGGGVTKLSPGRPRERKITAITRPRSFASPARTHDTKRKRRRNEADLSVTGVGQA